MNYPYVFLIFTVAFFQRSHASFEHAHEIPAVVHSVPVVASIPVAVHAHYHHPIEVVHHAHSVHSGKYGRHLIGEPLTYAQGRIASSQQFQWNGQIV
ncbi:hypothetical protein RB195_005810 [Necator americanus]|uniref:Uncharacterized protein n=1 Tax=Necator americanus TaxID=51031 RepID=A0ABR1BTH0_NECAM